MRQIESTQQTQGEKSFLWMNFLLVSFANPLTASDAKNAFNAMQGYAKIKSTDFAHMWHVYIYATTVVMINQIGSLVTVIYVSGIGKDSKQNCPLSRPFYT